MTKQLVSLGGWIGDKYLSTLTSLAPGLSTGFNVFAAIRGGSADQDGTSIYFGNTDGAATGWSFRRLPDVAADPLLGAPAYVVLAFVVAEATEISVLVHIPKPLFVSRTFFLGGAFRGNGTDVSFFVNGSRLQDPAEFAGDYAPGDSGLSVGVSGDVSADRIIGAGYAAQDFGNVQGLIDAVHQLAFQQFVQLPAGAIMREALTTVFETASVALPEYIYDAWSVRGPTLTTITPLPNEGAAAGGDLPFNGSAELDVQMDLVPNFTGATNIVIVEP
jgi:hypothetical protein